MPKVARKGDNISTGHSCDSTAPIESGDSGGSETVFANGIGVSHRNASISPHTIRSGDSCVNHSAVVNQGSGTVYVEGIPLARVTDSADAGEIIQGSPDVYSG